MHTIVVNEGHAVVEFVLKYSNAGGVVDIVDNHVVFEMECFIHINIYTEICSHIQKKIYKIKENFYKKIVKHNK